MNVADSDTPGRAAVAALALALQPSAGTPYLLFRKTQSPLSRDIAMDFALLVPIALFVCITYAIKAVVDARVRRQMVDSNGSQELVRSMLEGDEVRRRHGSLRWGILLLLLAAGFVLIELIGWTEITPGVIAILLAATGLGNLGYYQISRRLK